MKKMLLPALFLSSLLLSAGVFTGADRFWRPRENMTFYLNDTKGGGFTLKLDIRDMNTYMEGPRPAFAFLMAPDGSVSDRVFIPDDGIVKNDPVFKDGVGDIYMDFRYREFHRKNSPGGLIPNKKRSPFLSNPEKIPARSFTLKGGTQKGIHRLAIAGSWDHWFSLTPSRSMTAAIHPGQAGLYVHKNQLSEAWLFVPQQTKQLMCSVSEEVEPFNWTVKTETFTLPAKHFLRSRIFTPETGKAIRFSLSGTTPGAMFHIKGAPMLICENKDAALAFHGGLKEPALSLLEQYHPSDPKTKEFLRHALGFNAAFGFRDTEEIGKTFRNSLWNFRSSWWDFGDGWFKEYPKDLPQNVKLALKDLMEKWCMNRYVMEMGACTNQWAKIQEQMADMYEFTGSPVILEVLKFNAKRICTKNSLGRMNPDPDRFRSGFEPDSGYIDCGIMGEALGHDNEYNLETETHLTRVWNVTKQPEILAWQEEYYRFKTHHTLSRNGNVPRHTFLSCSPTDSNFRTRYYTHKTGAVLDRIAYGSLWGGKNNPEKRVWPFLEKQSFMRIMDNRYVFIKNDSFYLELYLGPNHPVWQSWTEEKLDGNAVELLGFKGMGYGGWQPFAAKTGGISALWIPGCGPVLLANNHNAMYSNALWGKVSDAWGKSLAKNVTPGMVSESFANSSVSFHEPTRTFTRTGKIPRTPLDFERKVMISAHQINVSIQLTAQKAFELKEMYESIPLFSEDRILFADGKKIDFPEPIIAAGHNTSSATEGISDVKFSASEIILRNSAGRGIRISFGKKYDIMLALPLKYRKESAAMSGVSLKLPVSWNAGERYTVQYTLVPE